MDVSKIRKELNISSFVEEENKLYEEYLASSEAQELLKKFNMPLDVIKKNIIKIHDYLSDIEYCKHCRGTKYCKKENPLLVTNITYSNGIVERNLIPCRRMLEQMGYENEFIFRDYSDEYLSADVKTMDRTSERKKASKRILNIFNKKDKGFVYIKGAPSSGRTYFAAAIANYFASNKQGPIAFINTSFRFKELYDLSFNDKDEFASIMKSLMNCNVLILDDFGNEYKNDLIRDGILFQILYERSNKKLLTIFTSDFKISEIEDLYATSKAGAIRAKQIRNLLQAECVEEIDFGSISVY